MAYFAHLPSTIIFWTVRNYKTAGEMLSPVFPFFGFKWRLKFTRFIGVDGGGQIRIDLESLSASKRVQNLSMISEIRMNDSFCQEKNVVLQNKMFCVWTKTISQIFQYCSSLTDLSFSIKLTPSKLLNQQFRSEEHERQATLEKIPWMTSLLKDIGSLYNNKGHSDYELKCKQVTLAVHKAILSARCGYFAALFSSPMKESDKKYVEFQNMEPECLQHVISYFYTGTLPKMSLNTVHEVYSVADMFLCEPLKTKCVSLMVDDFIKEDKTVPENKKEENPSEDSEDCKTLLKQLFLTKEWQVFYDGYPDLARQIFKPILFGTVKI